MLLFLQHPMGNMGNRSKRVLIALFLLSFGELVGSTGLCKFQRMFPSEGRKKTCQSRTLNLGKDVVTDETRTSSQEQPLSPSSDESTTRFDVEETTGGVSSPGISSQTVTDVVTDETRKSSQEQPLPPSSDESTTRFDVEETTGGVSSPGISSQTVTVTLQTAKVPTCLFNMIVGNCTCVATCEDPTGQHDCYNNCTEGKSCNCPEGLLLKDDHCVHPSECACFLSEIRKVLRNNEFSLSPGCSRRCVCRNKKLICDNDYQCSLNTACEERNNSHQCYCKDGFGGDRQNLTLPTDCLDIFNAGSNGSGIYTIKPTTWPGQPFEVYCNMDNGGGWTVFQRRVNGSVNFYCNWESYKQGFGILSHEFWLGNGKLFSLTNQADYELRIDIANFIGGDYYATYDLFRIADEYHKYRLSELGTFGGTVEVGAMQSYRAFYFTTHDRDNDIYGASNCAHIWRGGWWYSKCYNANLNGDYSKTFDRRVAWQFSIDGEDKIRYAEMKIRPIEGSACKKTI